MKVDPMTLARIKQDLVGLVSGRNRRDTASFAAQLLAEVYYEIKDAMEAGATQAEIVGVFEMNGVPMPLARFSKTMYYLRELMPPPPENEAPSPALVKAVSGSLRDLSGADRKRVVVRTKKSRGRIPMHDKVRDCAAVIVDVCTSPGGDLKSINRALRAQLGHGWTLTVALQFAAGEPFAQWAQGAWPTPDIERNVRAAHQVARLLRERGQPEDQGLPEALRRPL